MARSKLELDLKTHPSLSPETMVLAVQAEKERRAAKGCSFHCFVVDGKEKFLFKPTNEKLTELDLTLRTLRSDFMHGRIPDNTRVQLLVKNGAHWTAADLEFSKEKGMSAFILDAAKDARYWETVVPIYKTFKKEPHEIYLCAGGLQYDSSNCAVFSLHHALKASKIGDLHRDLHERTSSFSTEIDMGRVIHRLSHNQLPPSLVTTIQRPASVNDYLKQNAQVVHYQVTKKGGSVGDLVWRNIVEENGRFTNKYISRVKAKAVARAEQYLQQTSDPALGELLDFRRRLASGTQEIKDPKVMPAYHVRSVSGLLSMETATRAPEVSASVAEVHQQPQVPATQDTRTSTNEEQPFIATEFESQPGSSTTELVASETARQTASAVDPSVIDRQKEMKDELALGRRKTSSMSGSITTEADSRESKMKP